MEEMNHKGIRPGIHTKGSLHTAVSIGESIFVLGGWGSSTLKSVEMYDTRSQLRNKLSNLLEDVSITTN